MRKIIHIDMDAFYASVEQRDFPEYRGKCLAVGGLSERGVLTTASYEARKYGVRSAMPTWKAKQLCPQLIVVIPRFEAYREVSHQIREIFLEYTDIIEPLSLDEAYLDVSNNHKNNPIATELAKEIKSEILRRTGLTASAGVSFNKFLAKIASDMNKPDGLFVITPKKADEIINQLPIERFYGIGKVTAEKMKQFGILFGADLKQKPLEWLVHHFGKNGSYFYQVAHGEDNRPVEAERVRKSVSVENTFPVNLDNLERMQQEVAWMAEEVWGWVDRTGIYGRTINIKMKFSDFSIITKSRTSQSAVADFQYFRSVAAELLTQCFDPEKPVRLLGVGLSNLTDLKATETVQIEINFDKPQK